MFLLTLLVADALLIPMDASQTNHLRAYGVAYAALAAGGRAKWLLNYRGGSFLLEGTAAAEACKLKGVSFELLGDAEADAIVLGFEGSNRSAVVLEKAPKMAVYIPAYAEPWDDAVTLALDYAGIPYDRLWDAEVLAGKLYEYDWLHLHHEDFTGQYGKFFASYATAPWYQRQVAASESAARELGYSSVREMKLAVAREVRDYVSRGGFLFAMCSAPATLDIALAAGGTDFVAPLFDGTPADPNAQSKLDFSQTLFVENFTLVTNPYTYEHSNVDVTREALMRGENTYFTLFEFSAKFDPVPTMLTQDHTAVVKEFLGQDTGFRRSLLKKGVTVMGEVVGTGEAKYVYGPYGKGFFSFLGGHDPEDYQHFIGDPPTDLRAHPSSPGYRLILNNVLFPAAKRRKLKT